MKKRSSWLVWLAVALGVSLVVQHLLSMGARTLIPYSAFKLAVADGKVERVSVSPDEIQGTFKPVGSETSGKTFRAVRVTDEDLVRDLAKGKVIVTGVTGGSAWRSILSWALPLLLMLGFWWFLSRRMAGMGRGGFLSVGQSKAKLYLEHKVTTRFTDVAGVDEAKQELAEVIEFLTKPEKFRRLGGKLPKGILLVGPPGTGKTLLARAVAGEAAVPFLSISGSEFVEMFVGVGAARVRDLFAQARTVAPCIIFIDELDALGKVRGYGPASHDEREQTLNQLLVELDGFDTRVGVVLMAATNRPEILDPALLRAGRFDRHVLVDRPDRAGRVEILRVHARNVKLAAGADLDGLAGMTAGLVGADLANLVNEAALLAVRRGKDEVELADLDEALERVIAGLEKKSRVLTPAERQRVAHHEVGHALVSLTVQGPTSVRKISIIPRGISALGYTLQSATEDRFLLTRRELEDRIAVALGGRVAEEVVFGDVLTGAQDDLGKATAYATSMVRSYGMSRLGSISFDQGPHPLVELAPARDVSEATAREIDGEVRRIIDEQHGRVTELLRAQVALIRRAALKLLEHETLSGAELEALCHEPTEVKLGKDDPRQAA